MFKILFVDDDPSMRLLLKRILSFDYEVETAESGREALALVQRSDVPFAVVVADLSMAHGDGLALLSEMRRVSPESVRVLLSGDHRLELEPEMAREANVFRMLLKPIDTPTLTNTIREAVAMHVGMLSGLAAA